MVHKPGPMTRKPSSEVEPKESVDDRIEALEKKLDEILETYDPDLQHEVEALTKRLDAIEQRLQRHGIRNMS